MDCKADKGSRRKLIHKDAELEFSKVIIPQKMRSVYWKYYGFPADSNGTVVTRETIICTLCNKAIAYNKNTTNLRTHLTARHSEVLPALNLENAMKPIKKEKKSSPIKADIAPKISRRKVEVVETNETISTDIEVVQHDKSNGEVYNYQDYSTLEEPAYEVEEVNITAMNVPPLGMSCTNLTSQIQEMLVTDLLPLEFIEGIGFLNFTYQISNNANVPRIKDIETSLTNLHESRFKKVLENLKAHSETRPFVLSFEIWRNLEEQTFASVYVNNISRDFVVVFEHVLFCTVELDKFTDCEELFMGINLKNCSAAVVMAYNPIIDDFLSRNGIPVIPCFNAVINRAVEAVFNLNSVSEILTQMSDLLAKHSDLLPEVEYVPRINRSFPWTKYNLVKFFSENVVSDQEPNELLGQIKELVTCLNPLKAATDTLIEEANALSSLIKPLTKRLLQQHFCTKNTDSPLTAEIKDTVNRELSKSVLSNDFLTVSAFLDPRFFKFLELSELKCAKQMLEEKEGLINFAERDPIKASGSEFSTNRKSGLKMFFETSTTEIDTKLSRSTNVEFEINKYRSEAVADLEYDPLMWWTKFGHEFDILQKIAEHYNCAPCCVNRFFRRSIKEQIEFSKRRALLNGNIVNQILFLHYNKKL